MGGGGAASTSTTEYQQNLHSRVLLGFDQRAYDWQGTSIDSVGQQAAWNTAKPYSLAPGAMRFVFERGITDKGGNPYDGVDTYDPDAALTVAGTATDLMTSRTTALAPSTDWTGAVTDTNTKRSLLDPVLQSDASSNANSSITEANRNGSNYATQAAFASASSLDLAVSSVIRTAIDNAVTAFRNKGLSTHLRGMNRFAGGMADINAVQSSAFVFGMAMLEGDFAIAVEDYRSKLEVELFTQAQNNFNEFYKTVFVSYLDVYNKDKTVQTQFVMESTKDVINLINNKIDATRVAALIQQDFAKLKIVAKSEQVEKNLEIDAKDSMWDLDLFQTLGNLVSSVNGSAVPTPRGPSRTQSAIGGMATGAMTASAMGAKMGATTGGMLGGPPGIALGAAIGMVAGLMQ